jgi:hypothetical protein
LTSIALTSAPASTRARTASNCLELPPTAGIANGGLSDIIAALQIRTVLDGQLQPLQVALRGGVLKKGLGRVGLAGIRTKPGLKRRSEQLRVIHPQHVYEAARSSRIVAEFRQTTNKAYHGACVTLYRCSLELLVALL